MHGHLSSCLAVVEFPCSGIEVLLLLRELWAVLEAVRSLQTMLLIFGLSEVSIAGEELCRDQWGELGQKQASAGHDLVLETHGSSNTKTLKATCLQRRDGATPVVLSQPGATTWG